MNAINTAAPPPADNVLTIKPIDGELRILDTDLAARLGFARPRDIRKLINRLVSALDALGPRATVARVIDGGNATEFYLNRKQAIFITAKSDTPNATEITIEIIEKFDAYERGEIATSSPASPPPAPTITESLLVPFLGASLLVQRGPSPETTLVGLRRMSDDMDLSWPNVLERTQFHPAFRGTIQEIDIGQSGNLPLGIPLSLLETWLETLNPSRSGKSFHKLNAYRSDAYNVLFKAVFGKVDSLDALRVLAATSKHWGPDAARQIWRSLAACRT